MSGTPEERALEVLVEVICSPRGFACPDPPMTVDTRFSAAPIARAIRQAEEDAVRKALERAAKVLDGGWQAYILQDAILSLTPKDILGEKP